MIATVFSTEIQDMLVAIFICFFVLLFAIGGATRMNAAVQHFNQPKPFFRVVHYIRDGRYHVAVADRHYDESTPYISRNNREAVGDCDPDDHEAISALVVRAQALCEQREESRNYARRALGES